MRKEQKSQQQRGAKADRNNPEAAQNLTKERMSATGRI